MMIPHETYCRWTEIMYEASKRLHSDAREHSADVYGKLKTIVKDASGTGEK